VLSDIRFLQTGEVDEASGTFRMFEWNPDGGELLPREFDFTPGDADHRHS
jgi:hypothetical protein